MSPCRCRRRQYRSTVRSIRLFLTLQISYTIRQPLTFFAVDGFLGFRILFVLALILLVAGWRCVGKKSPAGLIMLALTAFLGWRSQRHAPFFGVAALAFAGPFLEATLARLAGRWPRVWREGSLLSAVAALYLLLAVAVAIVFLPQASLCTLAPVGHVPVRETDILMHGAATGNLAVPFRWGGYAGWRLYPRVKVSIDGRYETVYPDSTFELSDDFYEKRGLQWDRLIREHVWII